MSGMGVVVVVMLKSLPPPTRRKETYSRVHAVLTCRLVELFMWYVYVHDMYSIHSARLLRHGKETVAIVAGLYAAH